MSLDRAKVRRQICRVIPSADGNFTVFDHGRLQWVDQFYLNCQRHRDYYRGLSVNQDKQPYFNVCFKRYPKPVSPTEDFVWRCSDYHRHPYSVRCPCPELRYEIGRPRELGINLCGKIERFY